jgi:hypothetical protein
VVDRAGDLAAQQTGEHGAEDGHAEGATELLHRGHRAGRRTGLVLFDGADKRRAANTDSSVAPRRRYGREI